MSSEPSTPQTCPACAIVAGRREPTGGVLRRGRHFVLHALDGPSPLPGWLVLTSVQHARALYSLDEAALGRFGPAAAAVMNVQRQVLGAEHVYAMAIGDVLLHCHLHLIPRYRDTPAHLRGRGAFDASLAEHCSPERLEAAAQALGAALQTLEL